MTLSIALLTISDSRTLADDPSGDCLQQKLERAGHRLAARDVCRDDRYAIRARISQWITDSAIDVVIT
ncbi:MAG: molybdenum cofactor biosynthesis protein, partial [Prochlorococcus sp.]|nr:molybdenum cofactor biosynthesis protein [Prochlorococcus sp.]